MSKIISTLFFDIDSVGITRYSMRISKEIRNIEANAKITACYMLGDKSIISNELFNEVVDFNDYSYDAGKVIDYVKPDVVVVFAHRIPDYAFVIEAKKRGIKTITMQHGIERINTYKPNWRDLLRVWKNKQRKLKLYYKVLKNIYKANNMSLLSGLLKFNKNSEVHEYVYKLFGDKSVSDYALVFGSYWKEYYKRIYYQNEKNIFVIGTPDLDGFDNNVKLPSEPTVCYLATVMVEDAMVSRERFLEFIAQLAKSTKGYNVNVKLHPRSDRELYKELEKNNAEFVQGNEFPIANLYIGHTSTINAKALYVTENLLLYSFDENVTNPYSEFTKLSCCSVDSLDGLIKGAMKNTSCNPSNEISEKYWLNKKGAIKTAAEIIADI